MPDTGNTFAMFSTGKAVLLAYHVFLGQASGVFPNRVFRTRSGWGLPLSVFGEDTPELRNHLTTIAEQLGATIEFAAHVPGQAGRFVPLSQAIHLTWNDCDLIRRRQEAAFAGLEPGPTGAGLWDPAGGDLRYLLAASDDKEAKTLFDALTAFLADGLDARPVHLANGNGETPFRYFWLIRGQASLAVIKRASRVWWGSCRHVGRFDIFFQWPHMLRVPYRLLQRIPWAESSAFVLLGPDDPKQLVYHVPPSAPALASLPEYARLEMGVSQAATELAPDTGTPLAFRVRLRLLDRPDPTEFVRQRIRDLEGEIRELRLLCEAKEQARKDLEVRNASVEIDTEAAHEPLFVYSALGDEPPRELQRLLIEWSDQSEELRALRYQKIDARGFLDDDCPPGMVAHVLTTASALGQARPSALGARLAAYRPVRSVAAGQRGTFSPISVWATHGLRLFVPYHGYRQYLELYPRLAPSELAASKLAEALGLPSDRDERRRWCVILCRGREGEIRACRLWIPEPRGRTGAGFRPLVEAFSWRCNLDVAVAQPTALAVQQAAVSNLGQGIVRAFEAAVSDELEKREDAAWTRQARRAQAVGGQVTSMTNQVTAVQGSLRPLRESLSQLAAAVDGLVRLPGRLSTECVASLAERVAAVRGELGQLNQTHQRLTELGTRIAELRRSLRSWLSDLRSSEK